MSGDENFELGHRNTCRTKEPAERRRRVEKVAASIKAFGFRVPIIVDPDCVIIADHTRPLAALRLGIKEVPVYVALLPLCAHRAAPAVTLAPRQGLFP